jgi:hypothetical protein
MNKRQCLNNQARKIKNIPEIIQSSVSIYINAKWSIQYRKDCSTIDSSEMYRLYYARIRLNPHTNPNYVKYLKKDLDLKCMDGIIDYFTYADWTEYDNKKREPIFIQAHTRAMSLIRIKYNQLNMRISDTIQLIERSIK